MVDGLIKQVPIVGSAYGLVKCSIKMYNASSPIDAVCQGISSVVIDCSPPVVKYPILCSYLIASSAVAVISGNPLAIASTVNTARMIIEEP